MSSLSLLAEDAPATVWGLPGSSADLSACAVSFHPGRPAKCTCSLLPLPWQASPLYGGLAASIGVTRPIRVRLRYGSRVRSPGLRRRDYSRRRPVRYLLNEQFARQPPFRSPGQPGLSWRSVSTGRRNSRIRRLIGLFRGNCKRCPQGHQNRYAWKTPPLHHDHASSTTLHPIRGAKSLMHSMWLP